MFSGNSTKSIDYLAAGIELGENSDIKKASICKFHKSGNLKIGSKCLIEGKLNLYTENSIITICNNVFIGYNTLIGSAECVEIEEDVLISFDCLIMDNDNHNLSYEIRRNDLTAWKNGQPHDWNSTVIKPVKICKGAWIGAKSIILKGVTLGEGCVVGAGSVVTKNVEPYTMVAGNPAKFIKSLK